MDAATTFCRNCGYNHLPVQCTYLMNFCRRCQQTGHSPRWCPLVSGPQRGPHPDHFRSGNGRGGTARGFSTRAPGRLESTDMTTITEMIVHAVGVVRSVPGQGTSRHARSRRNRAERANAIARGLQQEQQQQQEQEQQRLAEGPLVQAQRAERAAHTQRLADQIAELQAPQARINADKTPPL